MSKKEKNTAENAKAAEVTAEAAEKTSEAAEKAVKKVKKAKTKSEKPSRFNKTNELQIILLSVALSFTVFFFSPIDIFIGNQREFVVEFKYVLLPMLLTAVASSAVLFLVMNLFLLIHQWVHRVVSRLVFGFLLAIYTQSLLLNSHMASITGDDTKYTDDLAAVVSNAAILIFILILPLVLHIIASCLPKNKVLNFGKGMVMPYIAGLIFVMQLVGIGSTALTTDFSKYKKMYTKYLAYEPSMSLSSEENVVVFLADRLDGNWMDQVIKRYPDVKENLIGFTFYQNNISHNTNTFPAIPQMLTTKMYKGEEWADYTSSAWDSNTLGRRLVDNGYDVNLLIDNITTFSSIAQLDGQCTNISDCDSDAVSFNYINKGGIIPTMTLLSLSKHFPYALKTEFTRGMGSNLSQNFINYEREMPDLMPMAVGVDSDLKYYKYLRSHGLDANNSKKTFSFIHLNCSHGDSRETVALYNPIEDVNIYSTTRGGFQIIFEYISQMKQLGIYDKSTIIILGDHGRAPEEIEISGKPGLTKPITTALLIKPKNAPKKLLKTNSDAELSNDFFAGSVLEYAGVDRSDFEYTYNDVIEGGLHPDRYMQTFDWRGFGKVVYKAYYKVTGDARDFSNWEEQPEHE